jgi:hypothetical protein
MPLFAKQRTAIFFGKALFRAYDAKSASPKYVVTLKIGEMTKKFCVYTRIFGAGKHVKTRAF